jgi:transposase-like protein
MAEAVRMRGEGLSLRQIARQLGVNVQTIHADLARWSQGRGTVTELFDPPARSTCLIRGADQTPGGRVIEFRRPR